jgi:hypothetical protein
MQPLLSMKEKLTVPLAGLKDCWVAGGAVTSLHTNKPIVDFDIYPKSVLARDLAIAWAYDNNLWGVSVSKRALTFVNSDEMHVQIMLFDTFETADKIFDAFDFTCCMGAFDLDTQKFKLHRYFLLHASQRFLAFNPKTRFPYASVCRVKKYEEKGYTIGKAEFYKVLLACAAMPINSWEDLKEQIGGVYGESIVIPDNKPYSLDAAIEALNSLKFKTAEAGFQNAEEAIACLSEREIPYMEIDSGPAGQKLYARLFDDSGWQQIGAKPANGRLVPQSEAYPGGRFFKKVMRDGEQYRAPHQSHFIYKLGEMATAESPHLYVYENIAAARNHTMPWNAKGEHAIIELHAEAADIIFDPSIPRVKRAMVVAEHPLVDPNAPAPTPDLAIPF